jgi:hypothetical protein
MNIVLDIETFPCDEQTKQLLPEIQPPAKLNSNNHDEWRCNTLPQLKEKQYLETALNGTFGRVICIGMLIFDSKNNYHQGKVLYGQNERELLKKFWSVVKEYHKPLIITHNGLGFDIPFLLKRSVINETKPSYVPNLARFRTDSIYDTMAIWANWDFKNNIKLNLLAKILGVGQKTGTGLSIFDMWSSGKFQEVVNYCFHDVYITYACYCKMNYTKFLDKAAIPVEFIES